MTTVYRANTPGETITFKFKGTRAAIYDIVGPDCGQVAVTVDDQPAVIQSRFEGRRVMHMFLLATGLPDAVHTVKIEVCREQPDKAKILAQHNQKMDDPKRFDGTAFCPDALLLVGDLVE